MGTLKEDVQKMKEVKQQITDLKETLKQCRDNIVENHSPVKIGDIVKVTGYSYRGKDMRVEHVVITTDWFTNKLQWSAYGKICKKDGSTSHNQGEWTQDIDI